MPTETELSFDLAVIIAAQGIVKHPTPAFSYTDIGDALIEHLRGALPAEQAIERMRLLHEDYERERERAKRMASLPKRIFIVGTNATWPRVQSALDISGTYAGWHKHLTLIYGDREAMMLRGYRGPDFWWVDWGSGMEQRIICRVNEFKQVTIEEARDVCHKIREG